MPGTHKWSEIKHKRKIAEAREANILDPIHAELDARVWDAPGAEKPVLKPVHHHWIKREIYDTLKKSGYTDIEDWLELVLTGSLTTYQYSNDSDVDISLFVDAVKFPEWSRAEMIGLMVGSLDGRLLPGTPFPLQDFVVGEGVKPHDLYKPGLRSGYSLDTGKWIVPPERERAHDVEAEENGFYAYALQMADKMERLLRYEPHKAVTFWHQIHKKRMRDQRAGKGDFAESNVIYKFLANRGLFPAISEASGEYIAKTAANDWFAPSYMIPDEAKDQIHQWVQQQAWPEGTKLPEPAKYHVTGLYSPSGFADPEHQAWAQSKSGGIYPVQTTGVDAFSPAEGRTHAPIVLRVDNPELIAHTEQMMQEGKARGLPISEFPGGYKPHITVAHSPQAMELRHPNLSFPVGPLRDLHGYYDELKTRQAKTAGPNDRWIEEEAYKLIAQNPGIRLPQIAEKLGVMQNNLYRLLPKMEEETNLVRPSTDPKGWYTLEQAWGDAYPPQELPRKEPQMKAVEVHGEGYQEPQDIEGWVPGHPWGDEMAPKYGKTSARVIYDKFRPDPVHPDEPGDEPTLPFIYNPATEIVHLGPAGAWHWQIVKRNSELQANYENEWNQPAYLENTGDHIHGAMHWPSKQLKFLGDSDPESQAKIADALGAPLPKYQWDFNSRTAHDELSQHVAEATLKDGGISVNLAGEEPTTGFAYAPRLETQQRIPIDQFMPDDVTHFIEEHRGALQDPGKYIGTWTQDGEVFMDVSEVHPDEEKAHQLAWEGHQKSMWDIDKGEEIPVRGVDYAQPSF